MSKNARILWDDAMAAAGGVVDLLTPVVDRVEIAGSLRRGAPEVGDIEILAIPTAVPDLFGSLVRGPLLVDQVLAGRGFKFEANGPLYKRFVVPGPCRVHCDLYLTAPEQWGVMLAIRTGPAEFSKRLVTIRQKGGLLPSYLQVKDGRVWSTGPIPTPEESDFFKLLGIAWIPPDRRS